MICALILGRKGSVGFPGKNTRELMGKPLAWYPMSAAQQCELVDKVFLSTDDPVLMDMAKDNHVEVIERPAHLCTKDALGEHAYQHGYEVICEQEGDKPELLVLLFCNAPTVTATIIESGIKALRENDSYDSAVTVSRYNMWSPLRARKIDEEGLLKPFVPFEIFGDPKIMNCDRDSQGDVWFADMSVSVVRTGNLEHLDDGMLPQKWMGQRIFPLENEAGLDIDYAWQMGQAQWWLDNFGGV